MRKSYLFLIILICAVLNVLFLSLIAFNTQKELPWHLKQIGVTGAWEITNGGNPNITIAVIDSGIDFTHPDLAHSQWINTAEIPENGMDDDTNGYIDDVCGWDFVSSDNIPGVEEEDLIDNHGTFIAGIIAARKKNYAKIIGIAYNVKIMDIRVLNQTNYLGVDYTGFCEAIRYAISNKADVISLSLQYFEDSPIISEAIKEAINSKIPVVSITGNYFMNDTAAGRNFASFPGAYENVIAVSATNYYYEKADYANYGSTVELVAPVGDSNATEDKTILSTYFNKRYGYSIGTSFACPQVAAVIALMKSVKPSLEVEKIREILHNTATDLGAPDRDEYFGFGLINATAAILEVAKE